MKKKLINFIVRMLNILFGILKLCPVKKKITYISRQSNETSVDVKLLVREMEKRHPEYQNIVLTKMIDKGIWAKIGYCFHMLRQMYHIATSEIVVLDTYCMAISLLNQRDTLIVIQMWHALGALKQFGYSILDKGEGSKKELAEMMKMHKNYSYVFCSSDFCKPYFAEAFHVSIDKMVTMPLPRLDLLRDQEYVDQIKKDILLKYPQLKEPGKRTIVYAPTFRKDENELRKAVKCLAENIDYSKYNLILKLHPLSGIKIEHPYAVQDDSFSTVDVCQLADLIILDYSAVLFEVMMLQKPLVFYVFDYDKYMENRDFYIDYMKCAPGRIVKTQQELEATIEYYNIDLDKIEKFRNQMIQKNETQSYTGAVIDFFENILRMS